MRLRMYSILFAPANWNILSSLFTRHIQCLLLTALLFLSFDQFTHAQSSMNDMRKSTLESTLPVVVMPSPNSAALTRTINENVDMYTGKMSVSIPIYTLKGRNIDLPISLQATVNSHKVNDVGSWVGMGWFLNGGGAITRVMKNLPDEYNGTISPDFNLHGVGYLHLNTAQEGYVVLDRFKPVIGPYADEYSIDEMKSIINRGNWNTRTARPDKGYDLQPDEFFFNFGNYSGKFVFDQSGNIRLVTAANLHFTHTISNNKITGFTVTTDEGFKYEFGNYALNAVEESKLSVSSKSLMFTYRYTHCSVWVPLPGEPSQSIELHTYEASPYVMATEQPAEWLAEPEPYSPEGGILSYGHPDNQYAADYPGYSSTWYLTKITAPTGDYINLNYVNNGTFNYVADRSFTWSVPKIEQTFPSRGCSVSPNQNDPFVFQGPYFKSLAPPKKIILQDNWFWHYPSFGDYTISSSSINLSSKRLSHITTNNGYRVDFIANTPRPEFPGDRRLDKISIQHNGSVIKEYEMGYETIENTEPLEVIAHSFKFPFYMYYTTGDYAYTRPTTSSSAESGVFESGMRFRSFLKTITEKGAGGERVPPYVFDYFTPGDLPFRTSSSQDRYGYAKIYGNAGQPIVNKLMAGVLKSITYPTGGTKEFTFDLGGNTTSWNGLRITSVADRESPGAVAITKNYSYGPFHAIDIATDRYTMPDVVFSYVTGGNLHYVSVADKEMLSAGRVNTENLTHGAAGGYAWVEESQPGNGSRRVEFYTKADAGHDDIHAPTMLVSGFNGGFTQNLSAIGMHFPFPQNHTQDWKRGLPRAEYIKGADGLDRITTIYNYDFTPGGAMAPGHSLGLQVSKYRIDYGFDWNWMMYGRYSFYPNWQILTSKTVREYAANGSAYRESTIANTYDKLDFNSTQYLFLREAKLQADSRNEQLVQRFRYPLDYGYSSEPFGQGMEQLRNKNVLNAIVEKYQYKQNADGSNRRYVGGMLNKYHADKPLLLQSFTIQPQGLMTFFTESHTSGPNSFSFDANYRPVTNFSRYSAFGNIEEQYKEADGKESYIWDETNTFPIAKATNAAYTDIAYTSFEDGNYGGWTLGLPHINTEEGFTGKRSFYTGQQLMRSGLDPNKTYILSYWVQMPFTTVQVNGEVSSFTGPQVNGWEFYEKKITGVSSISLYGAGDIDEVRLHPANAQMTTYLYDPKLGLVLQSDPNNRITRFEYDGLQRLKLIKDVYGNILKTFDYNYKEPGTTPMWANTAEKRCQPCPTNGAYYTSNQQVKQVDVNPNSSSYKSERWFDLGATGACLVQQDWQNISGPVCLTNANGFNTGMQRYVQRNMNPCSANPGAERNLDVANPGACPSNEPVWQPTEEYRCRPCSNPAYFSKFQERKWVDVNPVSNRPFEWRETGSFCTVPADYQYTGVTRCHTNSLGFPDGNLEKEKKDMNPCSDTYGNTYWEWVTDNANCSPVYHEIIYSDNQYHGTYETTDVYINFYQYINGVKVNYPVSNINIMIVEDHQSNNCEPFTVPHQFNGLNGTMIKLFEDVIWYYETPECFTYVSFFANY